MTLPDCPRCDSNGSLEKIRTDQGGMVWAYCRTCSAMVLIDAQGQIVHAGAK